MKKINTRSFTLVELLITMVVSVVIITGVLMSLINTMILNEYNQSYSIAMNIARAKLEEQIIKRSDFDSIVPIPNATVTNVTLTKAVDGIDGLYRVDVSNPVVNGSIATDIKDISVAVCFREGRARSGGKYHVVGDCTNDFGVTLAWRSANSPCSLSTSIARR